MYDTITDTREYIIDRYRLMRARNSGDVELIQGTIDACIAMREIYLDKGDPYGSFYFQAHCPNGHPDFPGSSNCWVWYDLVRGR